MSWLYLPSSCLPASGCSVKGCELGSNTWASRIAPFATLSGKLMQPASWLRAWRKARWMRHLSGPTLPPSHLNSSAEKWISSLPDSRARTCRLPAAEKVLTGRAADSSSIPLTSQRLAVRGGCFWRTLQESFLPTPPLWTKPMASFLNGHVPESWGSFPTAGGTRNGSLFQRPMWVPIMGGRDGSASRGERDWMTPKAGACGATSRTSGISPEKSTALQAQAHHWLTPHGMSGMEVETGKAGAGGEFAKQATHWTTPTALERSGQGERNSALTLDVKQWSTPKASEMDRGVCPSEMNRRSPSLLAEAHHWAMPKATDGTKGGPNQAGSKGDLMLPSMAAKWPTPTATDSEQAGSVNAGHLTLYRATRGYSPLGPMIRDGDQSSNDSPKSPRHLNPLFGAWLMGWPSTWVIAEPHVLSALETVLWRSRLQSHLSSLYGEPASSKEAA